MIIDMFYQFHTHKSKNRVLLKSMPIVYGMDPKRNFNVAKGKDVKSVEGICFFFVTSLLKYASKEETKGFFTNPSRCYEGLRFSCLVLIIFTSTGCHFLCICW